LADKDKINTVISGPDGDRIKAATIRRLVSDLK